MNFTIRNVVRKAECNYSVKFRKTKLRKFAIVYRMLLQILDWKKFIYVFDIVSIWPWILQQTQCDYKVMEHSMYIFIVLWIFKTTLLRINYYVRLFQCVMFNYWVIKKNICRFCWSKTNSNNIIIDS